MSTTKSISSAKSRRRARFMAVVAALAGSAVIPPLVPSMAAAQASDIGGIWYDDTGEGAVEIKHCGQRLCGFIVWLKDPISKRTGRPLADLNNPDSAKHSRTICGLQVLGDLKAQSDGSWDEGWVYDPKVGKSYDAALELNGHNRLTLTGYLGVKLLGKALTWTRAPGDLPRCQHGGRD